MHKPDHEAHDEALTSELPVVRDEVHEQLQEQIRYNEQGGWRRMAGLAANRRMAAVALAILVTVGVAGIALGAAGTSNDHAIGRKAAGIALPTRLPPARAVPPRANRGARPTPSAPPSATQSPRIKTRAWVAPMKGFHLTSCYGMRWGRIHQGIDFAVRFGAPIYAAHAGLVVQAGYNSGGYGNMVILKNGPHLFTLYGHSSKLLVHAGQRVKTGQEIALEGATGHVTGPHMHFEVWTAMWRRIEPGAFLKAHGIFLNRCQ